MSVRVDPKIPKKVIDELFAVDPDQKVNVAMHVWPGRLKEHVEYTVSATLEIRDKQGAVIYQEQPLHEFTELIAKEMNLNVVSKLWDTEDKMENGHFVFKSTAQIMETRFEFEHVVYATGPAASGSNPFSFTSIDTKENGDTKGAETKQKDWNKSKSVVVCISSTNVTVCGRGWKNTESTDYATVVQMYKNCPKFKQMMDICAANKVPLKMKSGNTSLSIDSIFSA